MRIHSALDDIYSGYVTSQSPHPVQRVYHNDPSCRVCRHGKDGFLLTSAPIPAPYPNPERHPRFQKEVQGGPQGNHFYHGTHWSPENDEPEENSKKEMEILHRPAPEFSSAYGDRVGKHWNTDLGTHFSSIKNVARGFATNNGGNPTDENARIAHATLHMQNPQHYANEHDFSRDAVRYALSQGKTFLPNNDTARKVFENYDDLDSSPYFKDNEAERNSYLNSQRDEFSHTIPGKVDKYGPDAKYGPDSKYPGSFINGQEDLEKWLGYHPDREEITDSFRKHLIGKGHDGVVYGNTYEGPHAHPSAIAFPETPIGIHHWEYLNNSPESAQIAEPDRNQHTLF